MKLVKLLVLGVLPLMLYGCGAKDNTEPPKPLTTYAFKVHPKIVWQDSVTSGSGQGTVLGLAQDQYRLIAVGYKGDITALDKRSGKVIWKTKISQDISASADDSSKSVFVPTRGGKVIALNALNGKKQWDTQLQSTLLSAPVTAGSNVIVHEHNGDVVSLDAQSGKVNWTYNGSSPKLMLQGSSRPFIEQGNVYVGFANGQVFAFGVTSGKVLWNRPIAIPDGATLIKRMVDVDSSPVSNELGIYAVAYHGNLVALNPSNGQLLWQLPLSSYNNMTATDKAIFVTNENSHVYCVNAASGRVLWQQNNLEARSLTGPVVLENEVVVGDYAGYLHFLNKQKGGFDARIKIGSTPVTGQGLVSDGVAYFVTRAGNVSAVSLHS